MSIYKPSEVARKRLLVNTYGSNKIRSHVHVLRLIKQGKLKAENIGKNPQFPYYRISQEAIDNFNNQFGGFKDEHTRQRK